MNISESWCFSFCGAVFCEFESVICGHTDGNLLGNASDERKRQMILRDNLFAVDFKVIEEKREEPAFLFRCPARTAMDVVSLFSNHGHTRKDVIHIKVCNQISIRFYSITTSTLSDI